MRQPRKVRKTLTKAAKAAMWDALMKAWRRIRETDPGASFTSVMVAGADIILTEAGHQAPADIEAPPDAEQTLYAILLIVDADDDYMARLKTAADSWAPETRRLVFDYCGALHMHASDHEDVEIPPKPAALMGLVPKPLDNG